jgi:hypothetical protein
MPNITNPTSIGGMKPVRKSSTKGIAQAIMRTSPGWRHLASDLSCKVGGDPDGDQYADPGGRRKIQYASSRNM